MAFKISKETKLESSKYKDNSKSTPIDNIINNISIYYGI